MASKKVQALLTTLDLEQFADFYKTHAHSITANYYKISSFQLDELLLNLNISRHSRQENTKLFNLEKYGVENVAQVAEIKKRQNDTILEKYGVNNISQSEDIKEKKKATTLEHFGVENPFQDKELMRAAYLNKLGVDNPSKLKSITNKIVETRTKNNSYITAVEINKNTRIEHYGSIEASYAAGRSTYEDTITKKYGSLENFYTKWAINQKNWCLANYGVENPFQVAEFMSTIGGNAKDSKPNLSFKKLLESYNINITDDNREFSISNRKYDFKIGNNLIEIDPYATHNSNWSPFNKESNGLAKDYHFNKSKLARENGYRCIHIWDWDNIDKIISLLLPRESVYARKCEIKEVDFQTVTSFINIYHLQGDIRKNNNDIRIGLYYEDNLVSIMTFGKPRYNKNYDYELLRYCSSKKVIGGAERLFRYFINIYKPESIISYCDLSKFNGNTYIKLGFKEKSISIGKHWYNPKTNEHITDNLLRQRGFDQLFKTNYGKGTNNNELMLNAGFVEIYDAGQATYVYMKELK